MIPHVRRGTAVIDSFVCSECDWIFLSRKPMPNHIDPDFAEKAAQQFTTHVCADFPRKSMRR